MKRIITILAAVLITVSVFAQTPEKMSYQAVIRDASDNLVVNQTVGMQISILKGSAGGTVVYSEIQTPTTNDNGLLSIEFGGEVGFDTISWGSDSYFIKTETDLTGGSIYTITGTSQLLSVPYALHAKTAESITGGITEHYVGELYGGGIIVSVWKASGVEHGLIASLTDQSTALIWTTASYQSTTVPGGALSQIDGLANSNAIVAQAVAGTTYAAGLCRAYSATGDGGLNDWYLPAAWELNQCYNAAFVVNTILGATNGFQFATYWSSTESGSNVAWYQYFGDGSADYSGKSAACGVRAVRRF